MHPLDDAATSASEPGNPLATLDSAHEALSRRLAELEDERSRLATEARNVDQQRRAAEAKAAELRARANAQRARIAFRVDDAERESRRDGTPRAEQAVQAARSKLADHDAATVHEMARHEEKCAELDIRHGALRDRLSETEQEQERVREELRQVHEDRQMARAAQLEADLERLAPVVEAQREAAGVSATADLSEDYATQAAGHATSWRRWGVILVMVLIMAGFGSIELFHDNSVPKGEVTAQTVVVVARNLLVVGLLLYAVRLASLQFRVHRHLEAVARNKAAALSTFHRITSVASEPEIRNSIAVVLAQSVFNSDETGFVDASQDHITLVERLASAVPRPGA